VLRGQRALYGLKVADAELARLAATIGSDAPFFLAGGSALGTGRGDVIERLPGVPEAWLVVLVPPISLADKTRRMYSALEAADFSDGRRTETVAARIRSGEPIDRGHLFNAFDAAAARMFDGLEGYRAMLREASGGPAHLAGAGPGLFSVHASRAEAESAAARLEADAAQVFVARTLRATEATRLEM
jgi:4-diphosphocytidyl-2-C-methyl-D-erythritol kinase